jgi:hypothetical protein
MRSGQKILCDITAKPSPWTQGPPAFHICAFQFYLVMSSRDRDALLSSRILSLGKALTHSVFENRFSDYEPCLTPSLMNSWVLICDSSKGCFPRVAAISESKMQAMAVLDKIGRDCSKSHSKMALSEVHSCRKLQ